MIVDQAGQLVWFHPLAAEQDATNFGVQSYRGRPALVWWQGRIIEAGFGQGEDVIYDSSYRQIASVRAGNGYAALGQYDPWETFRTIFHGANVGHESYFDSMTHFDFKTLLPALLH